ncbi:hypothetical protein BUI56_10555 [Lactococcus lactis subsp. lactis]|nr:hypothetical protein [Lactococcus lactis]MRL87513.1 hypothetical protein [Lactococcus cremoris]ADZ64507.1 hypothetical protein CVCAS_1882 [Lactococcus lactis subsp. lactis CV56]ARD99676.1 prophage protein [Lactococcus lactis subsp. lactis]KAF0952338.1 hypothetical protein BUI56_10555 [Lactococcus lactis subsp. lactis]KST87764.1 hypothetical protein ATCC19435_0536 [Lactococcus lactis subsp. lactis]
MNKKLQINLKDLADKLNNKIGKVLGWIAIAIVGFSFNNILTIISNPKHFIYQDIYKDFYNYSFISPNLMTIFLIFSFVMGIACLFAMVSLIIKKKFVSFLGLLVILLLSIFNFSNTFYSLKGISENRKISVNLEIVHPFISDKEYLLLKSQYMQTNSKEEFEKINNRIRYIANKNDANIN